MFGGLKRLLTRAPDLRLEGALLTDVGCIREGNEDSVAFATAGGGEALVVVADGMGGHAAGEVASAMAVDVVRQVFFGSRGSIPTRLMQALARANRAIFDFGARDRQRQGMGTTCTVVAFDGAQIFLAHVGDSRAYLLRNGKLQQLSEDHTLVARMLREGLLTAAEAANHPQGNVITKAVGTKPDIEPDVWRKGVKILEGDRLVVCSDGLHGVVDEDRIREIVCGADPRTAAQALIAAARAAGAPDNVSVGVYVAAPANAPAKAGQLERSCEDTRPLDRWDGPEGDPPTQLLARGSM